MVETLRVMLKTLSDERCEPIDLHPGIMLVDTICFAISTSRSSMSERLLIGKLVMSAKCQRSNSLNKVPLSYLCRRR